MLVRRQIDPPRGEQGAQQRDDPLGRGVPEEAERGQARDLLGGLRRAAVERDAHVTVTATASVR